MTPAGFWGLPDEDKLVMIAWSEARNEMTAYERQLEEAELNKPRPKPGRRG